MFVYNIRCAVFLPATTKCLDDSQSKDVEDQRDSTADPEAHCDNAAYLEDQKDGTALKEEEPDDKSHSDTERKSSLVIHMHYDDVLKLVGPSLLKLMRVYHMH